MEKESLVERAFKDQEFKKKFLQNPKKTIENEFGITLPDDLEIEVLEDTPHKLHFVIPCAEEISDETLKALAGGVDPYNVSGYKYTFQDWSPKPAEGKPSDPYNVQGFKYDKPQR